MVPERLAKIGARGRTVGRAVAGSRALDVGAKFEQSWYDRDRWDRSFEIWYALAMSVLKDWHPPPSVDRVHGLNMEKSLGNELTSVMGLGTCLNTDLSVLLQGSIPIGCPIQNRVISHGLKYSPTS